MCPYLDDDTFIKEKGDWIEDSWHKKVQKSWGDAAKSRDTRSLQAVKDVGAGYHSRASRVSVAPQHYGALLQGSSSVRDQIFFFFLVYFFIICGD